MKMKKIILLTLFTCQINAQCWKSIASGENHTIAIKTDGTLWAWGNNEYGELGNNSTIESHIPIQIGTDNKWKSVSCFAESLFSIALKTDGTIWGWGHNSWGQLATVFTGNDFLVPYQIISSNDWESIYTGDTCVIAKKTNGTLWGWGENSYGQLGIGTTSSSVPTPVQIGTNTDWKVISTGDDQVLAIKNNGTLWAWGNNLYGMIGNNSTTEVHSPIQIGTDINWKTISSGDRHSLAIKTDGTLWAWGYNYHHCLGDGTTIQRLMPIQIGTDNDWKIVVAGVDVSFAIKNNGSLWSWGANLSGELGNGQTTIEVSSPAQITNFYDWKSIISGHSFCIGLKNNDTLYSWGSNQYGSCGNNSTVQIFSPTQLSACNLETEGFITSEFLFNPNPTKGLIFVQSKNNEKINKIIIIDISGKTLFEQQYCTDVINVEVLRTGVYFLKIITENNNYQYNFIKE